MIELPIVLFLWIFYLLITMYVGSLFLVCIYCRYVYLYILYIYIYTYVTCVVYRKPDGPHFASTWSETKTSHYSRYLNSFGSAVCRFVVRLACTGRMFYTCRRTVIAREWVLEVASHNNTTQRAQDFTAFDSLVQCNSSLPVRGNLVIVIVIVSFKS